MTPSLTNDYRKMSFQLFQALDDIDTASDMAKGDPKRYHKLVQAYHKRRHMIVVDPLLQELYDEYYEDPFLAEEEE